MIYLSLTLCIKFREHYLIVPCRCTIDSHVVLRGHVHLGRSVHIHPFSVIGGSPQVLLYFSCFLVHF